MKLDLTMAKPVERARWLVCHRALCFIRDLYHPTLNACNDQTHTKFANFSVSFFFLPIFFIIIVVVVYFIQNSNDLSLYKRSLWSENKFLARISNTISCLLLSFVFVFISHWKYSSSQTRFFALALSLLALMSRFSTTFHRWFCRRNIKIRYSWIILLHN